MHLKVIGWNKAGQTKASLPVWNIPPCEAFVRPAATGKYFTRPSRWKQMETEGEAAASCLSGEGFINVPPFENHYQPGTQQQPVGCFLTGKGYYRNPSHAQHEKVRLGKVMTNSSVFFILFELQAPWHHHAALRSKKKMIAWIFLVKTITFPLIVSWHANQAAEWSPSSLPSSRASPWSCLLSYRSGSVSQHSPCQPLVALSLSFRNSRLAVGELRFLPFRQSWWTEFPGCINL